MSESPSNELCDLVRQAQAGSEQAAAALFSRYSEPLRAIVRNRLSFPLRRLFDSTDFVADTFVVVFSRKFADDILRSPQVLWPYLRRIAENKVHNAQQKYLHTQRFAIKDDVPIEESQGEEVFELPPDEALMLQELADRCVRNLLEELPPVYRAIVQLTLQGHDGAAIAQILNLSPRQVYSTIKRLKHRLEKSVAGQEREAEKSGS